MMEATLDAMDHQPNFNTAQQPPHTSTSSAFAEKDHVPHKTARILGSCNLCRRKKLRCDKANPCSNCLRSGVDCIPTPLLRVSRGRKGGRRKPDEELLKRIAKLENLVNDLGSTNGGIPSATLPQDHEDVQPIPKEFNSVKVDGWQPKALGSTASLPKANLDRYLSRPFWVTLSDEVRLNLLSHFGRVKVLSSGH